MGKLWWFLIANNNDAFAKKKKSEEIESVLPRPGTEETNETRERRRLWELCETGWVKEKKKENESWSYGSFVINAPIIETSSR